MAITTPPPASTRLTYEQYMAEGETEGRYDIIDGMRIFMAGASWRHQRSADKINRSLLDYEEESGAGFALSAPFDVLIRRHPLRTRQPDVLFISKTQLEKGGGIPETGPLEVAPELVVEIISDSETERSVGKKIKDYCAIGVKECWLVRPDARTVEVLRLTSAGAKTVAVYNETQTLQSMTFPDLTLAVADFFAS